MARIMAQCNYQALPEFNRSVRKECRENQRTFYRGCLTIAQAIGPPSGTSPLNVTSKPYRR